MYIYRKEKSRAKNISFVFRIQTKKSNAAVWKKLSAGRVRQAIVMRMQL